MLQLVLHGLLCLLFLSGSLLRTAHIISDMPFALMQRFQLRLYGTNIRLHGKQLFSNCICMQTQFFCFLLSAVHALCQLLYFRLFLRICSVFAVYLLLQIGQSLLTRLQLHKQRTALLLLCFQLSLCQADVFGGIAAALCEHRHLTRKLSRLFFFARQLHLQLFGANVRLPHLLGQLLGTRILLLLLFPHGFQLLLRFDARGIAALFRVLHAVQRIQPQRNLMQPQRIAQLHIFFCALRLFFQWAGTRIQFVPNITDAHQIFRCLIQFSLRFFFAGAESRHACRFLKDFSAIRALCRQNLINAALSNDGIAVMSQTGIHEHIANVSQTHAFPIQVIFALTGTEIFAGDHDLRRLDRKLSGRVVQNQRDLRRAHGTAPRRAAKHHIFHFCTAQALGRLFSQHPTDCIRNI